jgi:putative SOS response-associated peptidase YedK
MEVCEIIGEVSRKLDIDTPGIMAAARTEVAPTNHAPIVTAGAGGFTFEYARFGFAKWDGNGVIINARSETVSEKRMFKSHVQSGRCVVPTRGYFEWKAEPGRTKKTKHFIKDKRGKLLFMAGLCKQGANGQEFVIITKEPVGDITHIHDRMPVILSEDRLTDWLSGAMPAEALPSVEYECISE